MPADRGRQRERNIHDGVEQPPAGEPVTHQRPDHQRAEHEIDGGGRQRQAERQLECVQHPGAGDDGEEPVERQLRGLEEQRGERDQHDQRQPEQGRPHGDPEAGDHAPPAPYGRCCLAHRILESLRFHCTWIEHAVSLK